jgi:hypothetical protein
MAFIDGDPINVSLSLDILRIFKHLFTHMSFFDGNAVTRMVI